MRNEDNACIRYLMKEMDPSEEVLMERAMMEDEDLLIEVECLRQTFKRLDDLPQFSPPQQLTDSIVDEAVSYRNEVNSKWYNGRYIKAAAAAAIIVLGVLFGGGYWLWLENGTSTRQQVQNSGDNPASAAVQASPSTIPMNTVQAANQDNVEPWVDRNKILHFQDRFNDNKMEFDSILKTSTRKLTPLNDPFQSNRGTRSLQLTGGGE